MRGWKRVLLIGFVLCSCVGCDQVTKNVARETLRFESTITLLNDSIHLLYRENPGLAFSVGARLPEHLRSLLVTFGIGAVLLGMIVYTFRWCRASSGCLVGASLVIGGGLGNYVDRILNEGRVIDFIMLGMGEVRTAVFNVADVCILMGAVVLLYHIRRMEATTGPPEAAPPAGEALP